MKKQTAASLQEDYLAAMELTARHMGADPARAAEFFSKWAGDLSREPGPEFAELRVISLLNLCRMEEHLEQKQQSEGTRQEAIAILDEIAGSGKKLGIEDRLADVLIEFGEYRRAIRPCEQSIKLSGSRGSAKLARRLWRAGRTYLRAGFKEHAEEPLRKALDCFRANEGDPHIPVVLIDVGNALRKSKPEEAELSYREAASIWEQQGAYGQATVAWVNLGVLCSEQGRLDESLAWYEKARQVRQKDAGTSRLQLGSLANNIANLHRRMKNFDLAAREAEAAIALLEGEALLAEAYGTRGLILRDQGSDGASLEWFGKSRAEHARQPSPNTAQLGEVLDNEAAALRRLGRTDEAGALEQELAKLRGDLPALQTHEVVPVAQRAQRAGDAAGAVLIELDGVHLPADVYKECDLTTLENRIEEALESGGEGELDGHETGPQNTTLFLYGDDAEALFGSVEAVLRDYPLCQGARVTIRQEDRERLVVLP